MSLESDFLSFLHYYEIATKKVDQRYWNVIRYDRPNDPKLKERIYCYELYHQLRNELENDIKFKDYVLHGEMDKNDHSLLSGIPDFILHQTGSMNNNLAVIEAKHSNNRNQGITRDIKKLKRYMDCKMGNYVYSVCHVFGSLDENRLNKLKQKLSTNQFLIYHEVENNEVFIMK